MRLAAALAATVLALAPIAFSSQALAQDLKVTVQGRDSIVLTPADLANLPRGKATMVEGGKSAVYEGPLLNAALVQAGVVHGDRLMGRYLNQVVIVKAVDGYVSILSLAETDPFYRDNPVVIADRKNGQPLDAREGPYRVVVDGDQKPSRSARQVSAIEVRPAY